MKAAAWWVGILGGLLGIVGGLYLAWEVFPPPPGRATPADLAARYQELWVVLAAQADQVEQDPRALRRRLEALAWPDLPERVGAMVERGLLENWPDEVVRALAQVGRQLGARSPALIVVLATPVPTRVPPSPTLIPTPTPSPTATPTPSPSPTPLPTMEPSPTSVAAPTGSPTVTPTPSTPYEVERRPQCEASPLLRIRVFGPDGQERSGVRLWVSGPKGTETVLTGLKPGMGDGYADVRMEPRGTYRLALEEPEEVLGELTAESCRTDEGGAGWTGWTVEVRWLR